MPVVKGTKLSVLAGTYYQQAMLRVCGRQAEEEEVPAKPREAPGDILEYLRMVFVEGEVVVPRYLVWLNVSLLCVCVIMLARMTQ